MFPGVVRKEMINGQYGHGQCNCVKLGYLGKKSESIILRDRKHEFLPAVA